ncbi:hypothetical protein LOTGIDRAFT_113458 [Lottia gigantea]|uniref:Male-enhanced antigen 1 n=1 Tax=Lottia gigantea TaxID=225164 RepID=V4A6I2_LOTGI|nr:hypothetical protein LOTGIDRAFT_113458 [Lottia gigantea]ESO99533.1 hypothetical protein LOTGIDRAFT_113458 [Lottia gigantea]
MSCSSANSNSTGRTSSLSQPWRTSEPVDCHQPHLTHYPSGSAGSYLQAPELPKPDKSDILWNQPDHSNTNSIKMDENHAAEIKAAMAGFKLPMSNVPDWAKNVSDEQWKDTIIPKILSPEKR